MKYKLRRMSLKSKQDPNSNPTIKHPILNKMKIPKSQMKKMMKLTNKMIDKFCKNSNPS